MGALLELGLFRHAGLARAALRPPPLTSPDALVHSKPSAMATRRTPRASSPSKRATKTRRARPSVSQSNMKGGGVNGDEYGPRLLRFLVKPAYSLAIILATVLLYLIYPSLAASSPALVASRLPEANPFAPFLLLSYPVAPSFSNTTTYVLEDVNSTLPRAGVSGHGQVGGGQYGKGLHDLFFLAFYVVVHSFVRHTFMKGPLVWVANWAGVRKGGKTGRFVEQVRVLRSCRGHPEGGEARAEEPRAIPGVHGRLLHGFERTGPGAFIAFEGVTVWG